MPPELAALLTQWVASAVREEVARVLAGKATQEYLSTAEAADRARVAPGTLRRWIREGRLTSHGAGRELRVLREDLEKLMSPGRRMPRRAPARPVQKLTPEEEGEQGV